MLPPLFSSIEDHQGKPVAATPTARGWRLAVQSGVIARVKALRDARICRVRRGADDGVVQFGCGNATSLLCDSLYSPALDLALSFSGQGLSMWREGRARFVIASHGPVDVVVREHFLEVGRHMKWHTPLERHRFSRAPVTWSSGSALGAGITEAAVLENVEWLARNLLRFGCEWVEVGDGWQGGEGDGMQRRDWLRPDPARFPHGMQAVASAIRSHGLWPALWCMPLTHSDPLVTRTAPQLWLEDRPVVLAPNPVLAALARQVEPPAEWVGRYVVDSTAPEASAYLRRLVQEFVDEWGFEALRVAGLAKLEALYRQEQPSLWLPATEPNDVVRRGLHFMRIGAGPAVSFRADAPLPAAGGYCDVASTRGAGGVASPSALDSVMLNAISFYTEPGPLCIGDLPVGEARLHASWLALSGQAIDLGDRLPDLSPEHVELLRRILPVADIHSMELYPLSDRALPGIVALKVVREWLGSWDVVGLFNWGDVDAGFELTPARLGLADGHYICIDSWTGELLSDGPLPQLTVPRRSVRVFACWPRLNRPQFVGSNRHITQGAVDVNSAIWEERRLKLRGESRIVRGDPYTLRVYVPRGYRITAPEVEMAGPVASLTIDQPWDGLRGWWFKFARVKDAPGTQ